MQVLEHHDSDVADHMGEKDTAVNDEGLEDECGRA